MKKYLLIGGAGFIGINFADLLLGRGDSVTIFDNFSRKGTDENISWLSSKYKNVVIVKGDIRTDFATLKKLMEEHDVVHHLAAQVAVTTSTVDPRTDFEINALGTFNVLEAARLSKRQPVVIYASTNKVYGKMEDIRVVDRKGRYEYESLPQGVSESQPLDFHSPYGCSKGAGDQYVRDYARIYGLPTVVMRQSCIYGPHQFGVEDQGWVAWFIIAAALGKDITIYGDGKQVRDVLHVRDVFELWDAAEKNIAASSGKAYNVGGGASQSTSLLEFLSYIEKRQGKKIPLKFSDWRPGDQPVYISDISKASRELGWKPKTPKEKGFDELHEWVVANKAVIEKVLADR
ncbi:MAG: GDP-mannose 4,6-dehydratase [Patescibacteria group bacterium]|nr:GDP-mannose 4,6-dehydratase [Patescibacteria group bacterium]MDE2116372.1 GDP-mannose 4,6-dehydratase [Patescibacteria group bacterium]